MASLKPSAIQIFEDYSPVINKCRRELINQDWFQQDWWLNITFGADGFTFQMSKIRWFNHKGQGIHIEFWIEEKEVADKTLSIVLHFEADTPDRGELGKRFKVAFAQVASEFDDYRVNHKAICDKLQKRVAFSKSSLPKVVVAEFSRLQVIGSIIDDLLGENHAAKDSV